MGCDIHSYAERRNAAGEWEVIPNLTPFTDRNYDLFGWLANVRNYAGLTPICLPRGLPPDVSPTLAEDYAKYDVLHTASWLSVEELNRFDYNAPCENRRIGDGNQTCEPGQGEWTTYRKLLPPYFFRNLHKLRKAKAERVVFFFDN